MANNPLFGAAVGATWIAVLLVSWKLFAWIIGLAGAAILLARAYHSERGQRVREWLAGLPKPVIDLLAGAPFLLILVAVWLLK